MITLRPNQIEAADAVEDAFRDGCLRPLVDSCVGSGKSLIMAELARRAWQRNERTIIGAHTRELVEQNAAACRALGLQVGINAAALGERTWRAPVISAAIQSIYKNANYFGPVQNLFTDEAHLLPHSESGMYREFQRGFPGARCPGFSGTVFRLQGGSLVEGEGAPFDKVVYRYGILDGIRDGYLVPAFSAAADDKMNPALLKSRQGEFTGDSQDAQMIALMDNHICQMVHHGANRRAWLCFEASTKAAKAMTTRLNEWGVPTGLVLGETPAGERSRTIRDFKAGRLKCLVNVAALTTGFDVQEVDMLVMRRRTKSLGLYIQMVGRLLRTIGGNIEASIAAGKADGIVLDFAGNIEQHGPLDDVIQPRDSSLKFVSCESCGKRNPSAAARCWACSEPMTKLCPACLATIQKGLLDCPDCGHDMRTGSSEGEGGGFDSKLLKTPSGAALIASFGKVGPRDGGRTPVRKVYRSETGQVTVDTETERIELAEPLQPFGEKAKWIRADGTILISNGLSRTSAIQIGVTGKPIVVPIPPSL